MTTKVYQNRVIFHGDRDAYLGKTVYVKGVPMLKIPPYFKRIYKNETGGTTIEYSLKPFRNEPQQKGNPR